jgi:hypothetical protein
MITQKIHQTPHSVSAGVGFEIFWPQIKILEFGIKLTVYRLNWKFQISAFLCTYLSCSFLVLCVKF